MRTKNDVRIHKERNIVATVIGTDHGGQTNMSGSSTREAERQVDEIYNKASSAPFSRIFVEFLDSDFQKRINNMLKEYEGYKKQGSDRILYSNLPPIKIAVCKLINDNQTQVNRNIIEPIDSEDFRDLGNPIKNQDLDDSDIQVKNQNGKKMSADDLNNMKDKFSKELRNSYMATGINKYIIDNDLRNCRVLILCGENHVEEILKQI